MIRIPLLAATLALAALATSALTAQDPTLAADPVVAFQQLQAEFDAETARVRAESAALAATEEYQALLKTRDAEALAALRAKHVKALDRGAFAARFAAEAERFKGTEGAVPFLVWLSEQSSGAHQGDGRAEGPGADAFRTLASDHVASPALEGLLQKHYLPGRILGRDEAHEWFTAILDGTPHNMVRAWALFGRAQQVVGSRGATDEEKARWQPDLDMAAKLAEGTDLQLMIEAPKFVADNLQIGNVAPDIIGQDLDAVPFKLSDYRGKVVVLDFWGDW